MTVEGGMEGGRKEGVTKQEATPVHLCHSSPEMAAIN